MGNDRDDEISRVLGRIPSGLFILTAKNDLGQETGMLCSWVQQASFAPPLITVAIRRERYINEWLNTTRLAALNLVGESDKQLLAHFGRGFEADASAFEGMTIERGVTGVPVLSQALGYLEGHVIGHFPTGDHLIHVLEIVGAKAGDTLHAEQPMVHVRKSGKNY